MPSASRAPFTLATIPSTRISRPLYDGHIHISGATWCSSFKVHSEVPLFYLT